MSVVATWPFSLHASTRCLEILRDDKQGVSTAVVEAIRDVELDPSVNTVGSYSFPNVDGVLQLDAAIVEVSPGRQRCGAVLALEGYPGGIEAAFVVMEKCRHRILVGEGAKAFLTSHGLPPSPGPVPIVPLPEEYLDKGHDTVGLIAVRDGVLTVGCSTSGRKGKLPGRVGDSPIYGSGLYAEGGVGGAVCTGDGDKICSFPLAFTVVSYMRLGMSPQGACEEAMKYFMTLPQGDVKVEVGIVAMNMAGECGAACSPAYAKEFQFTAGTFDVAPQVYGCTDAVEDCM